MTLTDNTIHIKNSTYKFVEIYMGNTLIEHPWGKQHGNLVLKGVPENIKRIKK